MGEKITPATPLPWAADECGGVYANGDVRGNFPCVCATLSDDENVIQQDAAYIVHACNTFPALLEALENITGKLRGFHNITSADILAAEGAVAAAKGDAQ